MNTHQENQAAAYQEHWGHFDKLNASKDRTYGLKAAFAQNIICSKGLQQGRLLEVGCGTGLFTKKLAELLPQLNIVATDAYKPMLDVARKRLSANRNVTFDLYDASAPKAYEQPFDIICGVDIIHHIEEPAVAMQAWRQLAKSDGILLFLEVNPKNPVMYIRNYNHPEEKRVFLNNVSNLTAWLLASGWKNVIVKNLPAYLPSGPKPMWKLLTTTEQLIHKIPLVNKMSGLFLVYAENKMIANDYTYPFTTPHK
jgi:2-polyprenyl-3-methyl-5-hydroxy-6-metoxy-1,4-benzoquinol methylase